MTELLSQLAVLARRGPDADGWMEILLLVVMGVIWALGAVLKGARRKGAQRDKEGLAGEQRSQRQSWQERLVQKAEAMQRAAQAKGKQAAERMRQLEQGGQQRRAAPRPTGQTEPLDGITFQAGRHGETVMVYDASQTQRTVPRPTPPGRTVIQPRPLPKPDAQRPREAAQVPHDQAALGFDVPKFESVVERASDLSLETPKSLKPRKTANTRGSFQSGLLLDYAHADALKRAILHYEILGKPIAFRDPLERTETF